METDEPKRRSGGVVASSFSITLSGLGPWLNASVVMTAMTLRGCEARANQSASQCFHSARRRGCGVSGSEGCVTLAYCRCEFAMALHRSRAACAEPSIEGVMVASPPPATNGPCQSNLNSKTHGITLCKLAFRRPLPHAPPRGLKPGTLYVGHTLMRKDHHGQQLHPREHHSGTG